MNNHQAFDGRSPGSEGMPPYLYARPSCPVLASVRPLYEVILFQTEPIKEVIGRIMPSIGLFVIIAQIKSGRGSERNGSG
jgi:hypothetical protein